MSLPHFQEKQARIYTEDFDPKIVYQRGLKKSDQLRDRHAYLINLEHPAEIVDAVTIFAEQLVLEGFTVYTGNSVHTSICTWGIQFCPPSEQVLDDATVGQVASTLFSLRKQFTIVSLPYETALGYTQDTVVARGWAGEDFERLAYKIMTACEGIDRVKAPWGGHITLGRSQGARAPNDLKSFYALMKQPPNLTISLPVAVRLSHVKVQNEKITLETLVRVPLR